jgi:hypothetical protein
MTIIKGENITHVMPDLIRHPGKKLDSRLRGNDNYFLGWFNLVD